MICLVALGADAAFAEGDELDRFQLDELMRPLVVTAGSGTLDSLARAPASVFTVSREEIARHGWRSMAEILANVPGLYVIDDQVLPAVGVRGITGGLRSGSRVVKMMIDGTEVSFRPDLTGFLGPEYIPVEAIERVEVAKGPLSALYGANALVATVNVITRRAESGAHGEAAVRVLRNGYRPGVGGSALLSFGSDNFEFLLAGSTERYDRSGLSIQKTFERQDPSLSQYRQFFSGQSNRDIAQPASVFTKLLLKGAAGKLVVEGGLQHLDSAGEFQLNSVLSHDTRIALLNLWANARYERKIVESVHAFASVGYSQGAPTENEKLNLSNMKTVTYRRNFGYQSVDGSAGARWVPSTMASFILGADFRYEDHRVLSYTQIFNMSDGLRVAGDSVELAGPADLRRVVQTNLGLNARAVANPFKVLPELQLTGNFRLDLPNLFSPQYSWRAAASYRLGASIIKLVAGRAFQYPSMTMMYGLPGFGNSNNVIGSRTMPGLPPLGPRYVQSLELMVVGTAFKAITIDASIYGQQIEDKLEYLQLANNFVPRSQGQENVIGVELSARTSVWRLSPYLSLNSQIRENVSSSGERNWDINSPAFFPGTMLLFGADLPIEEAHLNVNVHARVVAGRGASQSNILLNNAVPYWLPAYATVDVTVTSLNLNIVPGAGETRLVASVKNLLGTYYSEPNVSGFDLPAGGRIFFFEVRQSF